MSRFSRRPAAKAGSRGDRASVQVQERQVLRRDTQTEPIEPETSTDNPASVGLSVSIGHSSDYGKDKFEVSAWCTVPCGTSESERDAAFAQCKEDVYNRLADLRREVVNVFELPFEEQ